MFLCLHKTWKLSFYCPSYSSTDYFVYLTVTVEPLTEKVPSEVHTVCSCCSDYDIRKTKSSKKVKILRNLLL